VRGRRGFPGHIVSSALTPVSEDGSEAARPGGVSTCSPLLTRVLAWEAQGPPPGPQNGLHQGTGHPRPPGSRRLGMAGRFSI